MSNKAKSANKAKETKTNELANELGADLEAASTMTKHAATADGPDYSSLEFLQKETFEAHFDIEKASSKYEEKREPEIQNGLKVIEGIEIDGQKINPLLILLGKWWENKTARAAIKKMIDEEADAKGYPADIYMQEILGKQIEVFQTIQSAIDRLRYAKTYYKPRKGLSTKVIMKPMNINGKTYNVPLQLLNEAKEDPKYKNDKPALIEYVISISTLADEIESL